MRSERRNKDLDMGRHSLETHTRGHSRCGSLKALSCARKALSRRWRSVARRDLSGANSGRAWRLRGTAASEVSFIPRHRQFVWCKARQALPGALPRRLGTQIGGWE